MRASRRRAGKNCCNGTIKYPKSSNYEYAKCDGCNKEMNADTGCHSIWWKDGMVTICNDCYVENYQK